MVAAEALAKDRRWGQVCGLGVDGGEPVAVVAFAGAVDEHLGEGSDVLVEGGQGLAVVQDGGEVGFVAPRSCQGVGYVLIEIRLLDPEGEMEMDAPWPGLRTVRLPL